ncbi:MAG: ribosome biogenesis GTP-binding protein YihA/YsxC [Bdellovibrionaceae bacterium]|nr:ribosome biogenesis GTP-binding protein YihA/YsxC [Pseudobdellovibrionaceae bacterium]
MPSARFIKSAVHPHEYPPDRGLEIAIAGRSNAGKSSLINLMTGSRIAKVSGTPGKTRLLNFFEMNGGKYTLVDMPGYGFAARSGDEMHDWHQMVESYLASRQVLRGLLLVMDIRREWTKDEDMLKGFTDHRGLPMAVVLTKSDKLSRNEIQKAVAALKKKSSLNHVFVVSSLKKTGHVEFEEWLYENWVKPAL